MGIFLVLIFYVIAVGTLATIGAVALGSISRILTRRAGTASKPVVRASILFPYLCAVFAGCWFISYCILNDQVFQRDPGIGDDWYTPLPNGYSLSMIDTTDQGSISSGRNQSAEGMIVDGVRQIQVSNHLIFGARDSGYFARIGQDSSAVDSFFELNTATRTHLEFKSLDELRQQAANQGVTLSLRKFASVFDNYRYTWFDGLAFAVLLLVPAIGLFVLGRWIWEVRVASISPASASAGGLAS